MTAMFYNMNPYAWNYVLCWNRDLQALSAACGPWNQQSSVTIDVRLYKICNAFARIYVFYVYIQYRHGFNDTDQYQSAKTNYPPYSPDTMDVNRKWRKGIVEAGIIIDICTSDAIWSRGQQTTNYITADCPFWSSDNAANYTKILRAAPRWRNYSMDHMVISQRTDNISYFRASYKMFILCILKSVVHTNSQGHTAHTIALLT